jgi:hypothetical protein
VLAEASRQGDVEAMTVLGKRLLTASRAPYQPAEGSQLLVKAANLGGADAAAQVAVLTAIGMHLPQSWRTSMAALVYAAERGSVAARGQLRVLASDRALAASGLGGATADTTLWRKLAATIDLNGWQTPVAGGADLNDSPLVSRFVDFVTVEVCRWLIDNVRGRLLPAPVYDAIAGKEALNQERTNTWAQFNIIHSDLVSVLVQTRMCMSLGLAVRQLEPMAVLHYDVGEQSKEHFDFVDPRTPHYAREIADKGQRIVTFLVYLNDDYDGGETDLVKLGIKHKGRRGEGLFFVNALANGEADLRTLHAGRPPTRGEKWIVSQFVRNRATF